MIRAITRALPVNWLMVLLILSLPIASTAGQQKTDATKLPCSDCHVCPNPTAEEPCLKGCLQTPANGKHVVEHESNPSMIMMGDPNSDYALVPFDHEAHARMEEMSDGCVSCHHYSTTKDIQPCRECHEAPRTLGQPGLKGIYHRQCLGCHQEWSHSNECQKCHKSSIGSDNQSSSAIYSDESNHAELVMPSKRVYIMAESPGEKVTFYHDEHSGKFGLDCKDCHQKDDCRYCHDKGRMVSAKKSEEEIHAVCIDCHRNDDCDLCHGKEERPRFFHDTDHWKLEIYHGELECADCHTTGGRITGLKADCNSCHSDWGSSDFVHSVTGFELDEIHGELDCEDCHSKRRFHERPDCASCHEDGRSPLTNPPGIRREITTTSQLLPATPR